MNLKRASRISTRNFHVLRKLAIQMVISGVDGVVATDFGLELMPLFRPEFKMPEIPAAALNEYKNLPKWTEAAKKYTRARRNLPPAYNGGHRRFARSH